MGRSIISYWWIFTSRNRSIFTINLGIRRNYGVPVKVGAISGSAGSDIDNIIAQIEDAFSMSYVETTSREERHVSEVIILSMSFYLYILLVKS